MSLLGRLQGLLADLYDAPVAHEVHDYLITDCAVAAELQGSDAAPATDEQLLIAPSADGVELGLYVDAAVLERLSRRCPVRSLGPANLADFCTAMEGVSHFHYVVWSTQCERDFSLLELELQAEVDKYASSLSLLLSQRNGRFPPDLFERLFGRCSLLPHLGAAERARYLEAHHCAARFCEKLEARYLRRRQARPRDLLAELRAFYRLGRHAKLRHAQQFA